MPSAMDNSPYVVAECLALGTPFLASDVGGTAELVHPDDRARVMLPPAAAEFARAIDKAVHSTAYVARPRFTTEQINQEYARWFEAIARRTQGAIEEQQHISSSSWTAAECMQESRDRPLVSIIIAATQTNARQCLDQAVESALSQTCKSIEVIVVVKNEDALLRHTWNHGGKTVRVLTNSHGKGQGNGQGASWNQGAQQSARGDYLLFIDDAHVLLPWTTSTFFKIVQTRGADVVGTTGIRLRTVKSYRRGTNDGLRSVIRNLQQRTRPAKNTAKVDYPLVPGGPAVAGLFANAFAGPVLMIRRSAFFNLRTTDGKYGAGFSPSVPAGFEAWEFYARAHLANLHFEKSVEPLCIEQTQPSREPTAQGAESYIGALQATRPYYRALELGVNATNQLDLELLQRLISVPRALLYDGGSAAEVV